jgi:hypothetical protein
MKQQPSGRFTTKNCREPIYPKQRSPLLTRLERPVRMKSHISQVNRTVFFFIDSGLNRMRRQITPTLPISMNFNIPVFYQQTNDRQRFLLTDRIQRVEGNVAKRMIVFATDEQLRLLFGCSHILMDGTFDSSPPHFEQIDSIHGIKNDQSKVFLFIYRAL